MVSLAFCLNLLITEDIGDVKQTNDAVRRASSAL